MRALVLEDGLSLCERDVPERLPGEALVRVRLAGICNTDQELVRGYMGFRGIPGHEFVGVVEEADDRSWVGERVVGEINCVCHDCPSCRAGRPRHCLNRTVLGIVNRDGAFAEHLVLPVENLHRVPEEVPDEIAVFTEPVAAAFRILEQVSVGSGDRVIVLGDGKLGQLVAQVLHARTSRLTCVGKHPGKLGLLEDLGIGTVLAGGEIEGGADIVVEATGSAAGFESALRLVRPEGTLVLKTTVARPVSVDLSLAVIGEIRIVASRCGPFAPALEALAKGDVVVRPMISDTFGLEDAVEAFGRADASGVVKVLLAIAE